MPRSRKRFRSIAIYGTHSAGAYELPPEGTEIWRVNNGWTQGPYDRLYELHKLSDRPWRTAEHLRHLKRPTGELWMFFPEKYKAQRFPVLEVLEWAPVAYFANSFAWMLGHALYEGVDEIWMYGTHLDSQHERVLERPCVEFWLGYAMGKGVKVHVPPRNPLLKGNLYGLMDSIHEAIKSYQFDGPPDWGPYAYSGVYEPDAST